MTRWVRAAAAAIFALSVNAATPKFEVASVKPCKADDAGGGRNGGGNGGSPSPGRLDLNCQSVRSLIRTAYVQFADGKRTLGHGAPVERGPAWIDSERYAIDAKAEGPTSQEMMKGADAASASRRPV